MRTQATYFASILTIYLACAFVYAETSSPASDISVLKLHKFDMTIAQDDVYGGVLEPDEFEKLVRFSIDYFLEHEGIDLVDGKLLEDSVGLVLIADYYRHLDKLSPVQIKDPMDINIRYWDPKLRFRMMLLQGKKVLRHAYIDAEDMAEVDYILPLAGSELQAKDKNHAVKLGRVFAYAVLAMLERESEGKPIQEEDFVKRVNELTSGYDKPIEMMHSNYIPIEVAADFLAGVKSKDKAIRIETYKKINNSWINSPSISEHLEKFIKENYKKVGWGETKEVREAMNALASSGDLKYAPLFYRISRDLNADKAIKNEVVDSLYILRKRAYLNTIVHEVPLKTPANMWEQVQLANRLQTFDPRTASIAIKEIYTNYKKDDYLQNVIAITLRYYAVSKTYRSELNEDMLAWGIRILGESGNPKFLEVLSTIEEKSFSSKLRRYAERYRKELQS